MILKTPINYWPIILWSIYGLEVLIFLVRFIKNLSRLLIKIKVNEKIKKTSYTEVLLKQLEPPHTFFSYIFFNRDKAKAKAGILKVMRAQEMARNNGDLEGFMQGYWKSDSLKFYGRNGLTKGWQNTLDNYKRGYHSKAETGTLNFVINDVY